MPAPKRGRPAVAPGQTPTKLQVLVAPADYDRALGRARREGISVPALLRAVLRRELADDDADE